MDPRMTMATGNSVARVRQVCLRMCPYRYCGPIPHEQVAGVLSDNDLLYLPTLGENFGHIIVESFAAGCPVLISDCTPGAVWSKGEQDGVCPSRRRTSSGRPCKAVSIWTPVK